MGRAVQRGILRFRLYLGPLWVTPMGHNPAIPPVERTRARPAYPTPTGFRPLSLSENPTPLKARY